MARLAVRENLLLVLGILSLFAVHVQCSSHGAHWPEPDRNLVHWSAKPHLMDCSQKSERAWPPRDYEHVPGVGYYKFHAYGTQWVAAREMCDQEGAHLVIVSSPAEAEALKALFVANPNSIDSLNSAHVWVGVHERGVHGKFFTIFGDPLEEAGYLNWSKTPVQPNDPTPDDCVSFYKSGVMYDDACNIKYGFVCEIEEALVAAVNTSNVNHQPESVCNDRVCPERQDNSDQRAGTSIVFPGQAAKEAKSHDSYSTKSGFYWTSSTLQNPSPHYQYSHSKYRGLKCAKTAAERTWPPQEYEMKPNLGFYKFHAFGATWQFAKHMCEIEGAHLVLVNSDREREMLRKLLVAHPKSTSATANDMAWVGAKERTDGKYYTIFGDQLGETGFWRWASGEPNDKGVEDCLAIKALGLADAPCDKKYPFVCEIELRQVEIRRRYLNAKSS